MSPSLHLGKRKVKRPRLTATQKRKKSFRNWKKAIKTFCVKQQPNKWSLKRREKKKAGNFWWTFLKWVKCRIKRILKQKHFYFQRLYLRCFAVDIGRKLNLHKTSRRCLGRLLNVLCTFNLRPLSTGLHWWLQFKTILWWQLILLLWNCVYFSYTILYRDYMLFLQVQYWLLIKRLSIYKSIIIFLGEFLMHLLSLKKVSKC